MDKPTAPEGGTVEGGTVEAGLRTAGKYFKNKIGKRLVLGHFRLEFVHFDSYDRYMDQMLCVHIPPHL